jgi:dihydroorotate dehydrogenase (NAD+) catalytic subunit
VNTIRGLALDEALRPILGTQTGGLSGPALKPVALAAVHTAYRATSLPIIGMGGVQTGRDAVELFAAGASAVALGTVLFSDPSAPARIRDELAAELAALGLSSPEQARGIAHEEALPKRKQLDLESRV